MSDPAGGGQLMETGTADPSRVIALLNALSWGDVDGIAVKLEEARGCCIAMEQPELALKLADAAVALRAADVKTYRRNVETVVSRLGHLR